MRRPLIHSCTLAGLLVVAAASQAQPRTDPGRFEYESNCLTCHGEAGRGDGPYSVNLKLPVPDLTQISRRNGGIYPAERVRRLIDGREDIKGHGGRQMPIWGLRYGQRAAEYYRGELHDAESFASQQVQALTDYLRTIQH